MAYPIREIEGGRRGRRIGCAAFVIAAFIVLASLRGLASFAINYQWWKEMGQLHTYFSMMAYAVIPAAIATVIGFIAFWISHARALKFAGTGLGRHRWYRRISTLALLLVGLFVGLGTTDTWTVVRYFGGRGVGGHAAAWHDPVFDKPL